MFLIIMFFEIYKIYKSKGMISEIYHHLIPFIHIDHRIRVHRKISIVAFSRSKEEFPYTTNFKYSIIHFMH